MPFSVSHIKRSDAMVVFRQVAWLVATAVFRDTMAAVGLHDCLPFFVMLLSSIVLVRWLSTYHFAGRE